MSDPSATSNPKYDDRLRRVPTYGRDILAGVDADAPARAGFAITRIKAMEKPSLEEALIEPSGGADACICNSVCTCVPVHACGCDSVCVCDTVSSCPSDCGCAGNCCVGVYYAPCWC